MATPNIRKRYNLILGRHGVKSCRLFCMFHMEHKENLWKKKSRNSYTGDFQTIVIGQMVTATFFAVILQSVFGGDIYYDVVDGHFMLKCGSDFYDWTGKVSDYETLVKWNDFDQYDSLQKKRIERDCIF